MSELKYNEPAERFAPIVEKSLYANATAVMVSSENGCWVHYAEYCERISNIKSKLDKVIAEKDAVIVELQAKNKRLEEIKDKYSSCAGKAINNIAKCELKIRSQKYKRCLDKVKWCEERISRYTLQQEIQGISWQKEIKFYRRLRDKFIEISNNLNSSILKEKND